MTEPCYLPSVRIMGSLLAKIKRLELKEVYRQFFARRGANPIQLHEAAVGENLKVFEYVGAFVELKKKFSHLMKNPYPLAHV